MEIDRRNLFLATAGLAMAKLVGPTFGLPRTTGLDDPPWHPITRSLLDRARRGSLVDGRANRALIERLIRPRSRYPKLCQSSRYKMAG